VAGGPCSYMLILRIYPHEIQLLVSKETWACSWVISCMGLTSSKPTATSLPWKPQPISWHGPTSCWEATIISCHLFVLCLLTMCIVKFLAGSCLNYELALLISGDVMASKFDQMIHQLEAKFPKGHCNVWTKMCLFKSCVGCGSSNHFTRLSIWPSR
jgi:hypothetical protein